MLKKIFLITVLLGLFFTINAKIVKSNDAETANQEVKILNKQIQEQKNKIEEIKVKQKEYSNQIQAIQKKQASLANQLAILENRLAKTELNINETKIEIGKINLEIKKTNLEIEEKNEKINKEKDRIAKILNIIYKHNQADTLEILLLNNSLSDFINQVKYLEDVNQEISNSLNSLENYKKQLETDKKSLEKRNQDLSRAQKNLESQKKELEDERENKSYILDVTSSSEKKYQQLLSEAKQEQLQAQSEIAALESKVRKKMSSLSEGELKLNDNGLIWPVPKNTITAYFHDPNYPFRYIFEHPAIDIRAAQGTPIKAAASGYVARVKFNPHSSNYAYIMLVHGDGLSTVYGHVSNVYVKEDEYVVQGQVIGASGGMPGTPGAGHLTTGPHLHFEVRLNGIPVNPLEYLP